MMIERVFRVAPVVMLWGSLVNVESFILCVNYAAVETTGCACTHCKQKHCKKWIAVNWRLNMSFCCLFSACASSHHRLWYLEVNCLDLNTWTQSDQMTAGPRAISSSPLRTIPLKRLWFGDIWTLAVLLLLSSSSSSPMVRAHSILSFQSTKM